MHPRRTALVWSDRLASYRFHADHPLNPRRLELTVGLLRRLGLVGDAARPVLTPRAATEAEVLAVHEAAYVDAVRRASAGLPVPGGPGAFGLGTADVPVVPGMHEAALAVAGATLTAAEAVAGGAVERAFSIAGGLHHARRAEASGFCVYNDLAIAIAWLRREHGARVMYIDIDAHHGDGVQWIFYDDPDVLKVSFHESGAYLYPGTGFVEETGAGEGVGFTVNVPLDAHTGDDGFLEAFDALVPDLADAFRPDVIVAQCGCDAHVLDPLTHLRCTTGLYEKLVGRIGRIADAHCGGRIIATGGGGYAIHTVVPRAWTLVWAALCDVHVDDALPDDWLQELRLECGHDVPAVLRDPPGAFPPAPRRAQAAAANRATVAAVRRRVLPLLTGWGLGF
jgi:acetoin utilization protein AcuC